MKAYIVTNPFGVFVLDERGQIIDEKHFLKDPKIVAQKLIQQSLLNEESEIIENLKKKGFNEIISSKHTDFVLMEENNFGEKQIRKRIRQLSKLNTQEFNEYMTSVGIEITRIKIKQNVKKDRIAMEVIDAIDEIDKSLNIYVARLREWYGLHFPEIESAIDKHEKFVKLVSQFGLRKNITEKDVVDLAKSSMGIELNERDEEILKEYATNIVNLYKLREHMEKYIEQLMKEIAPNFSAIAGPLLAARLITLAGGLEKLAKKSSSTIQLLGAEKALFRYLHGHGRSPKHGTLFIHPLIQQAPQNKRGKIARIISSKLNIAIKMDYYGHEDNSEKMKKELKERIDAIMKE